MVEVMLLPDCCYSDEGANTDRNDFDDPALKQDALLLERWTFEPVPRQSGDRFIEEKTLLLAIRSFVFFSQLSAWLSVSHGAVPRNILYRVSAADGELKLNFSHSPTEHVFPVPNVSHNVALKVSVQSLPRQSSYPDLNCSIHSNLGFYEKKIVPREHCVTLPRNSQDNGLYSAPVSQHAFTKQAWSAGPEGLMHARTNVSMDFTLPVRNSKLLSTVDNRYNVGTTPSKVQCFNMSGNCKAAPQEPSVRNFKSFSLVGVPCSPQDSQTVETNPLIGSLIQERQEVIARIAQHLLQCDQASSQINSHSIVHELSSINAKIFKNSSEDEQSQKKNKDILPICTSTLDLSLTTDIPKSNPKKAPDTPINSSRPIPEFHTSPKPQARRKLILFESNEHVCNTFQSSGQSAVPLSSNENIHKVPEKRDIKQSEKDEISARTGNQISNSSNTNYRFHTNTQRVPEDKSCTESHKQQKDNSKICSTKVGYGNEQAQETKCRETRKSDHSSQLLSIENCIKDRDNIQSKEPQDKLKIAHDENEDPTNCDCCKQGQRKCNGNCVRKCERLKNTEQKQIQLRHSNTWKKQTFRSLDGISTKAFHPRTGLPLLSSPVPQRKIQSGYFDLDTSLLKLKGLSTKRQHACRFTDEETEARNKQKLSSSAPPAPCLSLLGNFEESVLNYRFEPLGVVEGFTAEVGASGIFCPTHTTLPVKVSFYSVSDDNAPSPYMGNIALESLGKRGYRIPPFGTIQVTLFNPNKTVVKMFVVKYDLRDMPANHQTFLRQRTFSVPVRRETKRAVGLKIEDRTLRYLIHLRFQSSKSGKIYLHSDVRLLFSRKSMEVDSGAAYELKSYIETPTNPQYSPRC
ncbi:protein FAM214A isoform X2 [Xenopus laevis]|nr:protein FAM214A isoform X2 [Xenopus laevis]XP_018110935.2 protein FAM214A isoform X2 [Xenopus laevis]XP_018110936.1 protein FAM214A isoform X2 [Xenopus laevis]